MNRKALLFLICVSLLILTATIVGAAPAAIQDRAPAAIGTAFTYQGYLEDGGMPAAGVYDFSFSLFNASTGSGQIGATQYTNDLTLTDGHFTVVLDFGATAFGGDPRFLQIGVRLGSSSDPHTLLDQRQPITPAPYALHAAGIDDGIVTAAKIGEPCDGGEVLAFDGLVWRCGAVSVSFSPDQDVDHELEIAGVPNNINPVGPPENPVVVDLQDLGAVYATYQYIPKANPIDLVCQGMSSTCTEINTWYMQILSGAPDYHRDMTVVVQADDGSDLQNWNMLGCWPSALNPKLSPDGSELYLRYTVVCYEVNVPEFQVIAEDALPRTTILASIDKGQNLDGSVSQRINHRVSISGGMGSFVPGEALVDLTSLMANSPLVNCTDGNDTWICNQPGQAQISDFSMACVQAGPTAPCREIYDWFMSGTGTQNITVTVMDDQNEDVAEWTLTGCWPKIFGATLSSDGTALYPEYTFACGTYQVVFP
jgi:hypothetical protein